jgi:hypothetical protein
MLDLDRLRSSYILRDSDPDFAIGRRANLVYAVESLHVYLTEVNPRGPGPLDYLEYAKRDIAAADLRGAINALGNAKRAIHLTIDKLLSIWGLAKAFAEANFPTRLDLLNRLGAFPTRMILALNQERNLVEHEYTHIETGRAEQLIELSELFLAVSYPYLRHAVIGTFVGIEEEKQCMEWFIDLSEAKVVIRAVPTCQAIESSIGIIHYNIRRPKDVAPKATIPIEKSNVDAWLPYLDLFVYCTRRAALHLPKADERGAGLYYSTSELTFLDEDDQQ